MAKFLRRLFFTVTALAIATSAGMAQTASPPPDQVEEDWRIVIGNPRPSEIGPQLTTCMSPVTDSSTPFVAFDLNYRDYPSWNPGGVQVKVCSDKTVLDSADQGDEICQTSGETIRWTQRMSLSGGSINYWVVNGQSTTWGNFGHGQGLRGVSFATSASDLSSYSPDYSVARSGVGWQSNRVTSMTLVQVRYYSGGKLTSTDSTPRTVVLPTVAGAN
jgi:hypothetical protein